MHMQQWLIYSLLALLMWGIWGFLPKVALMQFKPESVLLWQGLGAALSTLIFYFLTVSLQTTSPVGILAGIGTGIFAFLGSLFFIFALSTGKASAVVTLTALYPLITIFLAILFLGETLTLRMFIGILFALIAIYLMGH